MPQFDPAVFSPQLIWLVIFFVALYVAMAKIALPRVDAVFAQRSERIAGNIARAEKLKEEAAAILAAYEKAIAEAKAGAARQAASVAAEIAAHTQRREGEFAGALAEKTAKAEAAIAAAKKAALDDIEGVAIDLARQMAAKLAGIETDSGAARATLAAIRTETGRPGKGSGV